MSYFSFFVTLFRVRTGSAFFVSVSINSRVIALGSHLVLSTQFYTIKFYYFFSKRNFRLVSSLFKVPPSRVLKSPSQT
jgi:hypothetical protein